jgi:hypothetical protein
VSRQVMIGWVAFWPRTTSESARTGTNFSRPAGVASSIPSRLDGTTSAHWATSSPRSRRKSVKT